MSSDTNTRKSENAIHDVLRFVRHILAMDAFANTLILTFLQVYHGKNIHVVNNKYQSHIAFVSTEAVMARALVEKASKLSKSDNSHIRTHAYYRDMNGKQRRKDFSDINIA
ncbi:126_t:CDS:2 [Funneliformis geosporum]|uniref:126_t:CDS:1 n=1 Tax=Funneliformis geosporum TaxID=1117311 RepID=A0A9W4T300_9GLOM|nr:126_t:CDS:2 [Funneliformis geosporum]